VAADAGALHRTQVQSFDWRVLQVARELEPAVSRHALAEPRTIFPGTPWTAGAPVPRNAFDGALAEIAHTHLGAAALAVEHTALSDGLIAAAHGRGMDVVAWTVNERAELAALIARGVDAVASDRPDRGRAVLAARGLPLPAPAAAPPSPATPRPAP
jgi:glycerophosphoryl diester phosphodiesterase